MKKTRHGLRSKNGQGRQRLRHEPYCLDAERRARERRKGETIIEDTIDYPQYFNNFNRNGLAVRNHLETLYDTNLDQLPTMSAKGTCRIIPAISVQYNRSHVHGRINNVISAATARYLLNAFVRMNEAGLKYPKAERNHSHVSSRRRLHRLALG
ncbi:hypothetical protein VNI00_014221 [Paramarasmius palmivorus]|uniref:Ribosomal protein S7 n=1 Tax=Paramarasmius palmivorus TaxID=297713 RepID=A0AAW0BUD6_9AGAR